MPASVKKAAPKKGGKKKEEMKLIAVVMERRHGFWPLRHSHYHLNVLELPVSTKVKDVADSARKAAKMAKKAIKTDLHFLFAEEVEIATDEFIAKTVADIKAEVGDLTK